MANYPNVKGYNHMRKIKKCLRLMMLVFVMMTILVVGLYLITYNEIVITSIAFIGAVVIVVLLIYYGTPRKCDACMSYNITHSSGKPMNSWTHHCNNCGFDWDTPWGTG
ncbi:hypothetical protein ES703_119666 [subsurface metagenome]